jgi:hypoxanthine phosphoribosyltransferase
MRPSSAPAVTVLIDRRALEARVRVLAEEIRRDAGDRPLHLIGVLKGAFVFVADLMRGIGPPVTCDFLAVSSYGAGTTSSGEVRLLKDLDVAIDDRDVLLVEDIVDSGATMSYLQTLLRARQPRTLRTVCLLDKATRRRVTVSIDYVGFTIPDRFVVGYGLDCEERFRELPFIGVLENNRVP